MTGQSHLEMHIDHRHWADELALWRDDLDLWRRELTRALEDVERVRAALEEQRKALDEHGKAVERHDEMVQAHERELARFEHGGADDRIIALARKHLEEQTRQAEQRSIHERIKKHHHALMAQWSLLQRAIAAPV